MLDAGGNVYYLAKLAGILGLNVQDLGSLQTGLSLDEFKQRLLDQGVTLRSGAMAHQGEAA
jgi:protocatechuate 4,5-dioxygenase alpha chain